MPVMPMKPCCATSVHESVPPASLVRSSGMNSGPEPLRGPQQAGEERDDLLEPRGRDLLGIERVLCAAALADEDDLGRAGRRAAGAGCTCSRRSRSSASRARPGRAAAAGCPWARAAGRRRTGRRAAAWAPRATICGLSTGNGSRKSSVGPPFLTYSVRLSICFWVSDDGWATSRTSRSAAIGASAETELTSYCFFSSVTIDHSGFWPNDPHVEAAHQLGVGVQDADLLPAAPRDDADRAGQLVLDRQAAVEERDDHLLEARGERDAQEDLGRRSAWPGRSVKTRWGSIPNRFSASRAASE